MSAETLLPKLLLHCILPLWLVAGLADWLCHRRARIEATSGTRESLLHAAQLVQVFIPTLLGLLFEVTLLVFGVMLLAWLLHSATALWDTAYAARLRHISPLEQHVHSYLELLPLFALTIVAVLNWDELRTADLEFAVRRPALPLPYLFAVAGSMCLAAIPIVEEWWRGLRHPRA